MDLRVRLWNVCEDRVDGRKSVPELLRGTFHTQLHKTHASPYSHKDTWGTHSSLSDIFIRHVGNNKGQLRSCIQLFGARICYHSSEIVTQ